MVVEEDWEHGEATLHSPPTPHYRTLCSHSRQSGFREGGDNEDIAV
jgi:hypothetical protein